MKKMEEILDKLATVDETLDYKEVYPSLAEDFKYVETHMFDSIVTSIIPLDCLVYQCSDKIKFALLNMDKLTQPVLENLTFHSNLLNPTFCNEEEAFSVISTDTGAITILLSEENYKEFKKLKIRHTMEVSQHEKELSTKSEYEAR